MKVSIKDGTDQGLVCNRLDLFINNETRFKAKVVPEGKSGVKITDVRLKESKKYCGSHPFACDINGGRRAVYLEGADWVEINDHINDVLDDLGVSANVKSAVCILRKGTLRRIHYGGHYQIIQYVNGKRDVIESPVPVGPRPHPEWNKDEDDDKYEDWCGKVAPASWYPEGTPGTYERKVPTLNG